MIIKLTHKHHTGAHGRRRRQLCTVTGKTVENRRAPTRALPPALRQLPTMRLVGTLLSFLTVSSLAAVAVAAVEDKLVKYSQLAASEPKAGLITLTNDLYSEIVAAPRNYTAVVLLTALNPKFGCVLCRELHPEYELLAKSWLGQHKDSDGLLFASLDFGAGRETFMKLGLNTAPVLYLFPPTVSDHADSLHVTDPVKFNFVQNNIPGEMIARWVAKHSPHSPHVIRPFDWSKVAIAAGAVTVALTILKLAYSTLKPAIYSRNLWAAISLILILLFTSGHMFNHIRSVPYVVNNERGGVSYIAGGFSNQFGLETQIVAAVYAILAFCVIALGLKMPRLADPTKQKISIWVWNAILLVAFSFLLSLFRQKNGGYPFFMPPFM